MGTAPMFRVKIVVLAVLAVVLASLTMLLVSSAGGSFPNLVLARSHFSASDWTAADRAIRDAFQYDSLEEPMRRSAWILRAKIAAAARGDDAGVDAATAFLHLYEGTLEDDELLELQNWFTQRGFFNSAALIRGTRRGF